MSTDHNFWRERRANADLNWGPSAYQPNALPLGQTGLQTDCIRWHVSNCLQWVYAGSRTDVTRIVQIMMELFHIQSGQMPLLCMLFIIRIFFFFFLYSAILCSRADSMHTLACVSEWVTVSFYSAYPWKWCTGSALWLLHGWCHVVVAWLVPREMLPFRRKFCVFYCVQPYTRLQCHFIQSHIGGVYVCLAVTCHLRFWQNDQDLLRAIAVTLGWNGYRNKSQHRKLTLEKKACASSSAVVLPVTCFKRL